MPTPQNVTKPLLMIGAGRSGTSWLMNVLFRHPSVQVVVDNTLVGAIYRDVYNTWWSPAFLKVHCGDSDSVRADLVARCVREAFCTMFPGSEPFWATKAIWDWTDESFGGVPNAVRVEMFPEARYLHFVRDPRTCLPSMLEYFGERGQLNTLARCEKAYCSAHSDALRMRSLGVECLVVHQEEIRDSPRRVWQEIEDFSGIGRSAMDDEVLAGEINPSKSMLGRVRSGRQPLGWEELTGATQEIAQHLGYEVPPGAGSRSPGSDHDQDDSSSDGKQGTIERLASEKGFLESELRAREQAERSRAEELAARIEALRVRVGDELAGKELRKISEELRRWLALE